MKWLEIIQIRTAQNRATHLMAELTTLLSDIQKTPGGANVILYRHADVASDFSLHLIHQSDTERPTISITGQLLSSVVREFGLVNHTIWILEKDNKS